MDSELKEFLESMEKRLTTNFKDEIKTMETRLTNEMIAMETRLTKEITIESSKNAELVGETVKNILESQLNEVKQDIKKIKEDFSEIKGDISVLQERAYQNERKIKRLQTTEA